MFEIAYKTESGINIVKYEGRINTFQEMHKGIISFLLDDGSILNVSIYNIYYYRIIR